MQQDSGLEKQEPPQQAFIPTFSGQQQFESSIFTGDRQELAPLPQKAALETGINHLKPMGVLSNYNEEMDRCMSEAVHFDELSSFMSFYNEDCGSEQQNMISPTDSHDNDGMMQMNNDTFMPSLVQP